MSYTYPTKEPEIVRAGETMEWVRSWSDWPASSYTVKYYLTGPASITLTAAAYQTTDHLVSVTAALTAAYTYGLYDWAAYAESGAGASALKYFLESGQLLIKTAAGKSHAKTMLDAIEDILEGRATSKDVDLLSKNLGSSSISKDPELLIRLRKQYKAEYLSELAFENMVQGKASGNRVLMRFRKPS